MPGSLTCLPPSETWSQSRYGANTVELNGLQQEALDQSRTAKLQADFASWVSQQSLECDQVQSKLGVRGYFFAVNRGVDGSAS